ncbi:MAG: ABC transporter permease [Firmicutes bacterium]|nr:ABC transporter permease [Bacillota bacterium]
MAKLLEMVSRNPRFSFQTVLSSALYIIFAILFIVYAFSTNSFLTVNNFIQVLSDASALIIAATGLTFVILTGSLDLSIGSAMMVSGALATIAVKNSTGNPVVGILIVFLISLAVGIGVGAINGFMIAKLKMTPFLATLGMMVALKGVALTLTNSTSILLPLSLKKVGVTKLFETVPLYVILALALIAIAQYMLRNTIFGRQIIALGCDQKAAEKLAINSAKITFLCYLLSGIFAGLAGFVAVINLGAVTPTTGSGYEFLAAACIVLGGTSLFGGKGAFLPNTLIGVLLLSVLENGLILMNSSIYAIPLIRGGIIFIAMYLDSLKKEN